MPDKQHLYLVDGSAYNFRAYHRLPPLTNPHGVPVGAVYGYTTMLWKLADDLDKADGPTHLAVILDKGATSFRSFAQNSSGWTAISSFSSHASPQHSHRKPRTFATPKKPNGRWQRGHVVINLAP